MKLVQKLQKEIFDLTGGYIATWLPNFLPFIGDFGVLSHGRLFTEGNLHDLGYIDLERYVSIASTRSFKYMSGVSISAIGSTGAGDQELSIDFQKEGAFIYHFQNACHHQIAKRQSFYKDLSYKILTGEIPWDDNFVIVDEIFEAEQSTVLISRSSNGSVNIQSERGVFEGANFADPALGLAFRTSRGTIFDFAGHEGMRPLYHVVKPTIKPRGSVRSDRGPKPNGPSLSRLYENAKNLIGGRELKPQEVELTEVDDRLVEATLKINGVSARFQIDFERINSGYASLDNLENEEVALPIKNVLIFQD